jgi:anti-anti-sigma factor
MEIHDNRILLEQRFIGFRDKILSTVNELIAKKQEEIVIDMTKVEFIDSIAIGDLVKCHLTCSAHQILLRLENVSDHIRRTLNYAGLSEMFKLDTVSAPSDEGD